MVYFGENNEYILCECEACKGEMYIEKSSVAEEDAYAYHLISPIKCRCGAIDEYISRAKKSCHKIKQELFALSDLLHKQQNVSAKMGEITAELGKKFEPPSVMQTMAKDALFSLKVFFILLGVLMGVEIFLFIVTALMFFLGNAFKAANIAANGNELFYAVNIFKAQGGNFLSGLGFDAAVRPLAEYGPELSEELILGYVPAAVAGVAIVSFYVFAAVFLVKTAINVIRLTLFASKTMKQKIKINQNREQYQRQLDDLGAMQQDLEDKIDEPSILPDDYKNIRAADSILRYFINNRVDSVREAIALFHDEDFKSRLLDYNKALYGEARQTRRYTKALYMMTSDENIKVDIKEEPPEAASNKAGDISSDAFSKIKSSPIRKDPKPALQRPKPNEESKKLEAPKPQEIDTAYEQKELDIFAETETETKPEPESEPEFEPETNEQDFDPEDC